MKQIKQSIIIAFIIVICGLFVINWITKDDHKITPHQSNKSFNVNANLTSNDAAKITEKQKRIAFKNESEIAIKDNNNMVIELKKRTKRPSRLFDANYIKSIDSLAIRNKQLTEALSIIDKNNVDWEKKQAAFELENNNLRHSLYKIMSDNY